MAGTLRRVIEGATVTFRNRLSALEGRFQAMDPDAVLARGYSVTTCAGRIVRDPEEVASGDRIHTKLAGGAFESRVIGGRRKGASQTSGMGQSTLFEEPVEPAEDD